MKKTLVLGTITIIAIIILTSCSGNEGITINDPWARPALSGGNGAAYFVLENQSDQDDILLSATTDAATVVELHDVIMVEAKDNDMESEMSKNDGSMSQDKMAEGNMAMQMVKQEYVPVASGETVTFKPGSFHVMLIGLKNDLKEGDTITLTLNFEQAGDITLEVPVEQR